MEDEGQASDAVPATFASDADAMQAADSSPLLRRSTRSASHAAAAQITRQRRDVRSNIRTHFTAAAAPSTSSTSCTSSASTAVATPTMLPPIPLSVDPSSLSVLLAHPEQLTCDALFCFQPSAQPDVSILSPEQCRIYFVRSFLSPLCIALFESLLSGLDSWQTGTLYGHPLPRLSKWFGNERYKYAGKRWPHFPHPPFLLHVQSLLTTHIRHTLDERCTQLATCLVNLYRDGNDSMGKHSDDEAELGAQPSIASLNIGQSRTFCMALKARPVGGGKRRTVSFELVEGSLLLMAGRTQDKYVHWVAKQPDREGVRYNLTFRPRLRSKDEASRRMADSGGQGEEGDEVKEQV